MITNRGVSTVGERARAAVADSGNIVRVSTENPRGDSTQHQPTSIRDPLKITRIDGLRRTRGAKALGSTWPCNCSGCA